MKMTSRAFFGDDEDADEDHGDTTALDEGGSYLNLSLNDIERYRKKYSFGVDQLQHFVDAFSVFDRDCDGVISSQELGSVLMAMGHRPMLREIEALIKGVDMDNSGTIYFEEFLQIMSRKMSDPDTDLKEVFDVFDLNADGFISPDELQHMLVRLGENLSKEEVMEMIKEADVGGDGKVDFAEFKGILTAK